MSYIFYLAFLGPSDLGKTLEDIVVRRIGVVGLLLILLIFALLDSYFGRKRVSVLKERLRVSDDLSRVVDERAKVVQERNVLSEEKLAFGEELLAVMHASGPMPTFPACLGVEGCCDILLVEDEKALHYLKEAIEKEIPGARVRLANNGSEGWAAVLSRRPDIVISDIVMPVMNGFQFVKQLREYCPEVPVLAISAYFDNQAQLVARLGKVPSRFEFLPKPTTLALLVGAIKRLRRYQLAEDAADAVAI